MKVEEIINDEGNLSAILIPVDIIKELKESLKTDSKFYDYLNRLKIDREEEARNLTLKLPNGSTIAETNARTAKVTEDIHRDAFSKGIPMFYRDERAKAPKEFIRANPDGSEDLVNYDLPRGVIQ